LWGPYFLPQRNVGRSSSPRTSQCLGEGRKSLPSASLGTGLQGWGAPPLHSLHQGWREQLLVPEPHTQGPCCPEKCRRQQRAGPVPHNLVVHQLLGVCPGEGRRVSCSARGFLSHHEPNGVCHLVVDYPLFIESTAFCIGRGRKHNV
jgi:hypothetical protein